MLADPLDQPADIRTLHALRRAGVLDDATLHLALGHLQTRGDWLAWARLNLMVIGALLMLSGVVFFFAYNWADMGRFQKLGLIFVALAGHALGAWWLGLGKLSGQVMLASASVFTGVFLAVFGQIYQTGADAYELFVGWSALILPWVMIARFAPLWMFWLLVVEVGAGLYWEQGPWDWPDEGLGLFFGLLNAAALILRESLMFRGFGWLSGEWLRLLLFVKMATALSCGVIFSILDRSTIPLAGAHIWIGLLVLAAGYYHYRYRQRDFACVSLAAMSLTVVSITWICERLSKISSDDLGMALVMALVIVAGTAALTMWLTRVHQQMIQEARS
jgi:uncharacterized membrane protein